MKLKKIKLILAAVIVLALALLVAGCGENAENKPNPEGAEETTAPASNDRLEESTVGGEDQVQTVPTPLPGPPAPKATSDDVQIYTKKTEDGQTIVVNYYGDEAAGYTLDKNNNIQDINGNLVVMAENVRSFSVYDKIEITNLRAINLTLYAKVENVEHNEFVTRLVQYPVDAKIEMTVAPTDVTNQVVIARIMNKELASWNPSKNADYIASGNFNLVDGELAVKPDAEGKIVLVVTAEKEGECDIEFRAFNGTARASIPMGIHNGTVEGFVEPPVQTELPQDYEQINASNDETKHTHTYTSEVVPATETSNGYTRFTCTGCGYYYDDFFTPRLVSQNPAADEDAHVHQYESSIIAPTATSKGYTLHVCTICGESYQDCFVDPVG